ncbi:hypothetical protein D3Y59_00670 [Hymenobacter oligotrophus]|uniref:DUF6438 domain-containing protein n=1 Tax=Hymenobacter oligotrophus TaxID=2319843 RepID=A0A3B7QWT7_9BACT|nr:hypothetical protein D3Y59_00670 [Hymenobacter oligotrophus]
MDPGQPPRPAPHTSDTGVTPGPGRTTEAEPVPTALPIESSPQVPTGPTTRLPVESEPSAENAPVPQSNTPVLVFRKTPCLGRCPHYEASIFADGRVRYIGYQNVAKSGTHELHLPAEVVKTMLSRAAGVGFGDLQTQYLSGASDMPSTFLTLNAPGKPSKTVQVEEGGPAELVALLNYISAELARVGAGDVVLDR